MPELNHAKHVGVLVTQDGVDLVLTATAGSIGAATAAQGSLADTALQAGDGLINLSSTGVSAGHVPKADGTGGITWGAESGGAGADAFTELTDAPNSFSGSGGKLVAVNSGATALEFVSPNVGDSIYGISLGTLSGTETIDLDAHNNVNAYGVLAGNTTLSVTNVPTDVVVLTLHAAQNGTGGYTVTYPANTTHLNGGNGSINPTANSVSIITLVTTNGGSSWVAAVADSRPTQYEAFYLNPTGNGSYYVVFPYAVTINLGGSYWRTDSGSPTLAYARCNNGETTFTTVSGSQVFSANDVLRITVSGFSSWLALTLPRTA